MVVAVLTLLLTLPSITGSTPLIVSYTDSPRHYLAEETPLLKLSGEFDFLLKEEIQLQLAALLTDKNTGDPISDATVTFKVYDPDLALLMTGFLVEEIPASGVYVYTSELLMRDMDFPKGIYVVHAHAMTLEGDEAVDMIQFHVDPPSSMSSGVMAPFGVGLALIVVAGAVVRRRLKAGQE